MNSLLFWMDISTTAETVLTTTTCQLIKNPVSLFFFLPQIIDKFPFIQLKKRGKKKKKQRQIYITKQKEGTKKKKKKIQEFKREKKKSRLHTVRYDWKIKMKN